MTKAKVLHAFSRDMLRSCGKSSCRFEGTCRVFIKYCFVFLKILNIFWTLASLDFSALCTRTTKW